VPADAGARPTTGAVQRDLEAIRALQGVKAATL
jgi:hypothetical protein